MVEFVRMQLIAVVPVKGKLDSSLLVSTGLRMKMMSQMNTVFSTELVSSTLVVMPQGDSTGFRYQDIHNETNAVITAIDRQNAQNLVINFENVEIVGSIMISAIIKLARKITSKKGQAAFCGASETMQEVIQSMNLTRLWPCFDSQEEAIRSFESNE